MSCNLKGKSLLTLKDYSLDEIEYLLDLSVSLKEKKHAGIFEKKLANKNVALIFEKPSTRTRCAFTVACADEGAHPEYLSKNDLQLGHKESVEDTARVLGRMFDAIGFRGFLQDTVEKLAKYSGIPVVNGLTDDDHPTQALADLMTVREHFGRIKGISLAYVGDGRNNMSNALMIACSKAGMNYRIISPKQLFPGNSLVKECEAFANHGGGSIKISDDIKDVSGCDVIYTDVWCSMGEEAKAEERIKLLSPYRVDKNLMGTAGKDAVFMHCLPAVKGSEVTEDVFESDCSLVFDESENRLHTIKAFLVASMQ